MIYKGSNPIDNMYMGGKLVQKAYIGDKKVYPDYAQIPSTIKDAMVLWYDAKRQGCTNENMADNPVLRDLSGNGHDATCYNFAWTEESGISTESYPNALVSDGVDDYCMVSSLPTFTTTNGFTVIAKRTIIDSTGSIVSKSANELSGAFIFELNSTIFSFYQSNSISLAGDGISWMTKDSYNGTSITTGSAEDDSTSMTLFTIRQYDSRYSQAALYSLLVFNRDLTTDEIEWVKANLIEDNEVTDNWYGIEFYTTSSYPDCIRIGNTELHKTLPVQSGMKGYLLADNGTVNQYLDEADWTSETRDGSQGQVMVEIPDHYVKFETDGDIRRVKMSTQALPGFKKISKYYISAYEAAVQRSTLQLCSVVNEAADYRGGNNSETNDANSASLLGMPATAISRTDFRTYARNRNDGNTQWNCMTYDAQKDLYWLFVVEYATLNSQKTYNADKDVNGYAQGGLGNGVTNISASRWTNFNSYYPLIKCGYTDSLGNSFGTVSYTMPFEYDGCSSSTTGVSTAYVGEYDASTAYNDGDYVSSGEKLYECTANAEAGTELTNTSYFTEVTRTTTDVPRYRGIENPFGHL